MQMDEALLCTPAGCWEQVQLDCDPSLRNKLPPACNAREAIADLPETVIAGDLRLGAQQSCTAAHCSMPVHKPNVVKGVLPAAQVLVPPVTPCMHADLHHVSACSGQGSGAEHMK